MATLVLAAGCGNSAVQDSTLGEQALADLSPVEMRALDDKTVSVAELEQAGQAFAECLQLGGFSATFDGADFGPDSVVAEIVSPSDSLTAEEAQMEQDRQDLAYDDCRSEVDAVAAVWVLQNQASEEEIQVALDALPECLSGAGVDIAADASLQEAVDAAKFFREAAGSSDLALAAVDTCVATTASATESALPGLAEALSQLNLGADG